MPADLFRRIDLDELYAPFRAVLFEVIARCRARGAEYVATSGYRSWGEQDQLARRHAQGLGGRAAPAGLSAHNYGIACDFVRDGDLTRAGVQPRWDAPAYAILGEESLKAGLAWGGSFGDAPHVQWPGFVRAAQLRGLATLVKQPDVMTTCWEWLDWCLSSDWREGHPRLSAELKQLGY